MSKLKDQLQKQLEEATDADVKALLQKKLSDLESDSESSSIEQIRTMLEKSRELGAALSGQGRDFDHFSKEDSPSSAIFKATTGNARLLIVKNWASSDKKIIADATTEDVEGVTPSDFVTPLYEGSLSDGSSFYRLHSKEMAEEPAIGWFGMPSNIVIEKGIDYLCEFNQKGYVASAEAM